MSYWVREVIEGVENRGYGRSRYGVIGEREAENVPAQALRSCWAASTEAT